MFLFNDDPSDIPSEPPSQEEVNNLFFQYLKNNRPSWEYYLILLAKVVASRSKDPNTQCGAVITDQNHRIISTGYNGSLQNVDDSLVPPSRPEKYPYFIHAEENAILFAKKDLQNCLIFVTGMPCHKCMRMIAQSGISAVFHGTQTINMIDDKELKLTQNIAKHKNMMI